MDRGTVRVVRSIDARRAAQDIAVLCWKLDRLGRSMRHLVTPLDELRRSMEASSHSAKGSTPRARRALDLRDHCGGRGLCGARHHAEFERERLRERTKDGLARAKAQGATFGRRSNKAMRRKLQEVAHLSVRKAAAHLGCSPVTVQRMRRELRA
jgi:DNA invertase Pin-like site-specific DNA recombinase